MITILSRLHDHAVTHPQDVAYAAKIDGRWVTTSWADFEPQVHQAAHGLISLGLAPQGLDTDF